MSSSFEDPHRWREQTDQANLAERALGQAVRAIGPPRPLSDSQMARLASALRPSRVRHPRLWIVVAASFLLGLATAASAARLNVLPRWLTGAAKPKPAEAPARRSHGGSATPPLSTAVAVPAGTTAEPTRETHVSAQAGAGPRAPEANTSEHPAASNDIAVAPAGRAGALAEKATVPRFVDSDSPRLPPSAAPDGRFHAALPTPLPLPAAGIPPDESHARAAHVAMLDRPMTPEPVSNSAVGAKPAVAAIGEPNVAQLLADAIRALRVDGSPESALALLDRHAALLAGSPYDRETLLVRAEALLALKRDGELLLLLDRAALAGGAGSRTLLVTRGRLRAAAHRCTEAVADFDLVLAEAGRADMQALLGRAACREKLGDADGARRDRERYRRQLPRPSRM